MGRNKIQQKLAILEAIRSHPHCSKSRLLDISNLSGDIRNEYFNFLLDNSFIQHNGKKKYVCTQKANKILIDWKMFCEQFGEDPNLT